MGIETNLEGKIALVTGAASGLGARFAQVLARAGAEVVIASRRVEKLKELRAEIEAEGGAAHVVKLDVTDVASIRSAVAHAETEAGPIDILVNNAGVSVTNKLVDISEEDYDFIMQTNTRGAFFMAQEVAKRMLTHAKANPKRQTRIINIGSVAAHKPISKLGVYGMSKAAIVQMTKAMALEWSKHGIHVNAINPGYIHTEINDAHWQTEAGQKLINSLPNKRLGEAADLDGLLLLLASDGVGFINGAIFNADDGMSVM